MVICSFGVFNVAYVDDDEVLVEEWEVEGVLVPVTASLGIMIVLLAELKKWRNESLFSPFLVSFRGILCT